MSWDSTHLTYAWLRFWPNIDACRLDSTGQTVAKVSILGSADVLTPLFPGTYSKAVFNRLFLERSFFWIKLFFKSLNNAFCNHSQQLTTKMTFHRTEPIPNFRKVYRTEPIPNSNINLKFIK